MGERTGLLKPDYLRLSDIYYITGRMYDRKSIIK